MSIIDLFLGLFKGAAAKPKKPAEPVVAPPKPDPVPEPKVTKKLVPIDQREANILAKLYPPFAAKVTEVLQEAREEGLCVYIFEGMRTMARQKKLYAKGRDAAGRIVNKKLVVTNAKPGSSFHNYGLAVDLVFDGIPSTLKVDWSWRDEHPWARLGQISQACGLEWAGSWKSFKEFPHHQIKVPGVRWRSLLKWHDAGGLKRVWKEIEARA